ncbi:MAG: hypothetical protein VX675_04970, partial [Planctomycetota bacterium]|nr:hypothetical protein [Planctomycetota bacterium]
MNIRRRTVSFVLSCLLLCCCPCLLAGEPAGAPAEGPAAEKVRTEKALPEKVTFTEHIAPIIFNNCSSCHRAGEVAPFDLLNYRD